MFWKRQRSESTTATQEIRAWHPPTIPRFEVHFDDMLKGYFAERDGERIRQFCVYVDGASRLVTSGDTVDRVTFRALIQAGAVQPSIQPVNITAAVDTAAPLENE